MNYESALKQANKTSRLRDTEVNINLPMKQYPLELYSTNSQSYGQKIPKKIIIDSLGILVETNPKVGPGDVYINTIKGKVHYEMKCSFTSKKNTYTLTQIRMWEDFQFFMISLFDRTDNFKPRFYVIPKDALRKVKLHSMHGNKETNKVNKKIELKVNFSIPDAYDFFGKHNILDGTSYSDLKSHYFQLAVSELTNRKENAPMMSNPIAKTNRIYLNGRGGKLFYEKKITIYFEVEGQHIMGNSNRDSVRMLIEHLGAEEAMKFFPNSILSKNWGEYHDIRIGEYYYNPRLSIRDIRKYMIRGSKNSDVVVKMTELR